MAESGKRPLTGMQQFSRIFNIMLIELPVVTALSWLWGWQWGLSALCGGATVLLAASLTRTAVAGMSAEERNPKRRIWLRLGWRLLLLALCLYAMLQAPWMRLMPLIVGMSLLFPALVVELILENVDNKSNNEQR
jgi:F0F1-type ATP synthase assembly protein I